MHHEGLCFKYIVDLKCIIKTKNIVYKYIKHFMRGSTYVFIKPAEHFNASCRRGNTVFTVPLYMLRSEIMGRFKGQNLKNTRM